MLKLFNVIGIIILLLLLRKKSIYFSNYQLKL